MLVELARLEQALNALDELGEVERDLATIYTAIGDLRSKMCRIVNACDNVNVVKLREFADKLKSGEDGEYRGICIKCPHVHTNGATPTCTLFSKALNSMHDEVSPEIVTLLRVDECIELENKIRVARG